MENHKSFRTRASVIAVRTALIAIAASPASYAADPPNQAAQELTKPVSTVEFGLGYVNNDSFKFGEYNGLQRKGPFAIGNFDVRGGGAYDSGDPTRWRLNGNDLGLDTRSVNGEYGQQGRF